MDIRIKNLVPALFAEMFLLYYGMIAILLPK